MKVRQILAWILTMAMVVTLFPAMMSVSADNTASSVDDAVKLKKELIITEDGMPNELRLEAYVTGSLEKSSGSVPADIILVLDQSGSMDDNITSDGVTKTKLAIMKEAVTAFTDKVAELNTGGDGSDYRVAIVGFGSEDTNTEILTTSPVRTYTWLENNPQYEYAQVPSGSLNENNTYYIASGSRYEEIEYYEYIFAEDGWYTDGGVWGGGDLVDVLQTTVYEISNQYLSAEYSNAFVNCNASAVDDGGAINNAIDALDGNGATRTDLGMELAKNIFAVQPAGTYTDRKKIVVVLTDGVPTTSNTFSDTVANNAIGYSKEMKADNTEVFALYFGNPSEESKNFMQGMSSNYPDATAYTNLGTQAKNTYYSAHNNASAITGVFNDIVYSIAANAQLDEQAILQDELTEYFKLPDTLPGDLTDEIRVYTSDKTATGWGEEVLFEDAVVEISNDQKTISVSGFDYAYYCVTEESKSETIEDYGKKLVVYIPIIADETADTIGGYLPTNVHAGVYENDIAVEYDNAAVKADGHQDDVSLAYMMENDEFFKHIGTDDRYEFVFNTENMDAILDEMFLTKPDGTNNIGVRLDYRIYDTNTDQSTGSDDTLVATLVVEPGDNTDITDITNWTFEDGMDTATLTIADNENSASKVYAIVCRAYNINPAYAQAPVYNMTYGLLNVTVVNEDVHIVGGVIDDGGTIAVDNATGTITYDMANNPIGYTEEIAQGGNSAEMTFTLKEGYVFRRIIEKTSAQGALDTINVLYDVDTGEGNAVFEADGTYKYKVTGATGGQIVEVYTRLKKFTLTTESGENSLIVDGRDYEYSATELLDVPFSAKEGYEITSVMYGETKADAVELIGMSDAEIAALGISAKNVVTASGYAADGTPETDLIQGEIRVPRTKDNYVAVTASPRIYKLTYKQYKRVVDNLVTVYEPYDTDATYYVVYSNALPAAPVAPGTEQEINGDNYTVSDWYRYHPNNEFTGLTDVNTAVMPAAEMVLHAYWTKNPSIEVSIPVKKIAAGNVSGQKEFTITGTYHEHLVGEAKLTVSESLREAEETLTMKLTDKQYDSFVQGNAIRVTESYETGDNWIYDTTEYTVHYNASGAPIIKKGDETVASADFTNRYNAYKVEYNLSGGTYQGSASIPAKTVKYTDSGLVPSEAVAKDNFDFVGWKHAERFVDNKTTYNELAGSVDVFSITLVAEFKAKDVNDVIYDGKVDPVVENKYIIVRPNGGVWIHDGQQYAGADEAKLLMDKDRVLNKPTRDGYTFTGWQKTVGTGDVAYIYTAQWDKDEIGEIIPDEGDDIPDIYQKKIIFKVVNGTWADGTTADIVKVVTLKNAAGENAADGKAELSAPVGMHANTGFKNGAWDVVPPTEVRGTAEETYTYSFVRGTTPLVPSNEVLYIVEHYKVNSDGTYPAVPTELERASGTIGGQATAIPKTYDGYCLDEQISTLTATLKAITSPADIVTLKLYYDIDRIGKVDPDDGDDVPDIYQKKITFKVVNGKWSDGTTADIVIVVDLLDSGGNYSKTGEADITALIPTGMTANSGYRNGRWNTTPETLAKGTAAVTYTYSFERSGGGGGGGGGTTNKYTLTYNTNGGNAIPSEKHNPGTVVKLDEVPVKEGYIFDGWHSDSKLESDVDEVKMTKNITVYAAWIKDNGAAGSGYGTPAGLNGEDHFAYVVGYPDGTVRPNANITRGEVTAIFFRLLKPDEVRDKNLTDKNNFSDIKNTDWHNTAISTMTKLGIVKGRYADRFVPDAYITRAEFATICARFDDSEFKIVDNFTDVKGHWAESNIHEAAAHGWIKGYDGNVFRPDQFITRAEAMTMINRVLNRIPETADDLLDDMIKWPDNSNTAEWYYLPVQEATNSHTYEMKNHIYKKWTALEDVRDWTQYQ